MDDLDQRILDLLGDAARQSVAVLARRLRVPRSTLQGRSARLERAGVIAGYTVRLGPAATGQRVTAHVAITIDPKRGDHVQQTLGRIAGVRTLHTMSGPFDLIAVVAAEQSSGDVHRCGCPFQISQTMGLGSEFGVAQTVVSVLRSDSPACAERDTRAARVASDSAGVALGDSGAAEWALSAGRRQVVARLRSGVPRYRSG
ncbi:MAG: Lrp/AsnC family transcriptional regulator [Pseudonocardiaceae bacterium]